MKKTPSYSEMLKILNDNNIFALQAFVANTVNTLLCPKIIYEEEFEEICEAVFDECFYNTDYSELIVWNIAYDELKKRNLI